MTAYLVVRAVVADPKDRAAFAEQMIGIVSHDLRNPLSTILMGTALLARGALSQGQQMAAKVAQKYQGQ